MGTIIIIVTFFLLVYFIIKRHKMKKKMRNTVEQFGEIKSRNQKKNRITVKTKEGEIFIQVTPEEFMSLGVGLIGIFRYNKDDFKLVSFTPYQKII